MKEQRRRSVYTPSSLCFENIYMYLSLNIQLLIALDSNIHIFLIGKGACF